MKTPRMLVLALLVAPASARAYDFIEILPPVSVAEMARPVAVAESGDRLYVLDQKKNALLILDANGKLLKSAGAFSSAQGLACGPDGEVLVADAGNHRVEVFGPDGAPLLAFGAKGSSPGRLSSPGSVAAGSDGRVFVADTGNDRVQVFSREGVFLFGFGQKGKQAGQFRSPTRVVVDPSDNVYVLDQGNGRIQKFGPDTRFVRDFPLLGDDFDVDEYGFLYILDSKRGKVHELGPDGVVLGAFGTSGTGPGQFRKPSGIAVAPDGAVLVADSGNGRVQRVRLTNKLKTARLGPNLAAKLLVSGPSATAALPASALAGSGQTLYAYQPKSGQFVTLGLDGKVLSRFGRKGKDPATTSGTRGFAVSEKQGIFVADEGADRVQVFDLGGTFKRAFAESKGMFASKKKEGRVKNPTAVAINEKGAIYVADAGNRRIDAFSPDGGFLFSFGPHVGPYELADPVGLAWDEAGFIYVLDRKLKKVLKCEPSGGFISAWGREGEGVGAFSDPVALAFDGRGYVFVLDRDLRRVSVFDKAGAWVTDFFARGSDERSLEDPAAVAVLGDRLVVSDLANMRISYFALHPRLAPPVSVSTAVVEGEVHLQWDAASDPWVKGYRVYRASQPAGPFVAAGKVESPAFKQAKLDAYQRYYYRVAVEARTGDLGPPSRKAEVFIPGAFNRAPIELSAATVGNIFPARYKWYLRNPVGSAIIANNVSVPFSNVKVSFRLKDYMDFPTEKVIESLEPMQKLEVPLLATLNNRILEVTEDTPIQAELTATYFEKGKEQSVSRALPLKVYARSAITWDDPRRIVSFITPNDTPVLDFGREALRGAPKGAAGTEYLNESLLTAIHLWDALGAAGVKYLPSPNNPFEKISEDPAFPVDYTQFPRETLRRKSGQCDDLTTLLASLLEGAGVRVAVLDYPGHMALMLDLGSNDPVDIGLPKERLVEYQDGLWLPVEPTMVGSAFDDAARKALFAYREMAGQGKARIIDARDVVGVYDPATLPPSDQKLEAPDKADCQKRFAGASASYLKERYEFLTKHFAGLVAQDQGNAELSNQLGMVHGQHGRFAEAQLEFQRGLGLDASNAALLNNLGNLDYIQGKYEDALKRYEGASAGDPDDPGIWMNLTRAALALGRKDKAQEYAKKAVALKKELQPDVETLLK